MVEAAGDQRKLLEVRLPADRASVWEARQAVGEIANEVGASANDVKIAVSEAVGNAVVHAYRERPPGAIVVRAYQAGDALVVSVADDGDGMRPHLDSPGLGLGISLITKVARDVRFDSDDHGTTVVMTFEAPEGGRA